MTQFILTLEDELYNSEETIVIVKSNAKVAKTLEGPGGNSGYEMESCSGSTLESQNFRWEKNT